MNDDEARAETYRSVVKEKIAKLERLVSQTNDPEKLSKLNLDLDLAIVQYETNYNNWQ